MANILQEVVDFESEKLSKNRKGKNPKGLLPRIFCSACGKELKQVKGSRNWQTESYHHHDGTIETIKRATVVCSKYHWWSIFTFHSKYELYETDLSGVWQARGDNPFN